jgi:hypothetical protein
MSKSEKLFEKALREMTYTLEAANRYERGSYAYGLWEGKSAAWQVVAETLAETEEQWRRYWLAVEAN